MTFAYFPANPIGSNAPKNDRPLMQTNFQSIGSLIAVDHVGFNTAGGGQHNQVTFNANNVPTVPTSPPVLFTNNAPTIPGLFFYAGDAAQSSNQYVQMGTGSTFLLGGTIIKWGTLGFNDTIGSVATTFASAFTTVCYGVVMLPMTPTPANGVGSWSYSNVSVTGFTGYRTNTVGIVTYFYIALGY